jgi:hypothetical protein
MSPRIPLILRSDVVRSVGLQHQALCVQAYDRAAQWFPLERIVELRCFGAVALSTPAQLACLVAGIRIAWFSTEGCWLGISLPADTKPAEFNLSIQQFVQRPDWETLLDYFKQAQERRALLEVVPQLQLRLSDLRSESVQAAFATALRSHVPDANQLLQQLEHMLQARAASIWTTLGLPLPQVSQQQGQPPLVRLLARLAMWQVYPALWRERHKLCLHWSTAASKLSWLERNTPNLERQAHELAQRFRHWLEEQQFPTR